MNIIDLSKQENDLMRKVERVVGSIEEQNIILEKQGVFEDYKKIFNSYVKLHKNELEALKRCLFLYWYSSCEPPCFTGLNVLDKEKIEKVLHTVNEKLSQNIIDYELEWMFGYYSNWNYIFEPFPKFKQIKEKMTERNKVKMPKFIDRQNMAERGQMGNYWNSLTIFK